MVPLALRLEELPDGPAGRALARRAGLVFGAVHFALVLWWIVPALARTTPLALPGFAAAVGCFALAASAFAAFVHLVRRRTATPLWLTLPVGWTAMEWGLEHAPSTLAYPWLGLGTSLTGFPRLVGMAELVGARGVGFWIVLVNGLVAGVVLALRDRHPAGSGLEGRAAWGRRAVVLAVALALPMAWGLWRAHDLDERVVARIAVVQPNVSQRVRLDGGAALAAALALAEGLPDRIEPGSADLVLLPEVFLPAVPGAAEAARGLDALQRASREIGAPILFGAVGPDEGAGPTNSVYLMEPAGLSDVRYDKRRLVPFVERAPFVPSGSGERWPHTGSYAAGTRRVAVEVDGVRFGVLVCYEAAFASETRAWLAEGVDGLLNLSNDAWYGDGSGARTTALWQHPAHLVMRAIETRVGLARAANTGISMVVDPVGRVHRPTGLFVEDVRTYRLATADRVTLYVRYGDLVGRGSVVLTLLLVLAVAGRGRAALSDMGR